MKKIKRKSDNKYLTDISFSPILVITESNWTSDASKASGIPFLLIKHITKSLGENTVDVVND